MTTHAVLFVCLGNICRSPLAEALFTRRASEAGIRDRLLIDSCATGHWHVGEPPDPRARAAAKRYDLQLDGTARRFDPETDPERFHWIIAMDRANRRDLLGAGAPPQNVHLMRSFDPQMKGRPESELDVPDPYYGGEEGFTRLLDMLDSAAAGLARSIADRLRAPR